MHVTGFSPGNSVGAQQQLESADGQILKRTTEMAGSSSGLQAVGSARGVRRQGDCVAARKLAGGRRRWLRHGRRSSHGHASRAGKSVTGTRG
jgi:hypothetical protein